MIHMSEKDLAAYLDTRDKRLNSRLLNDRIFRGKIWAVTASIGVYLVQIQRTEEALTGNQDQTHYACSLIGYIPQVNDIVDLIWRNADEAVVLQVVSAGNPSRYVQVTANQTPVTAVVDYTGLTLSPVLAVNRRYRIKGKTLVSSTVADDNATLEITDSANNVIDAVDITCRPAGAFQALLIDSIIVPTSLSQSTYKLRIGRVSGTGNLTFSAAATFPAYMLMEDLGV